MRFPPNFLDEIRARIQISDVVGRKVTWDKRKSNPGRGDYWACCPFHGEKSPSFHADNRKGRYHCFGCGASGDHFTFLVEQEGLSFPDAVAQLAAEAGIPLPARDADSERREAERASLHDVVEKAAQFFEAALQGPDGAKARAYLRERGLSAETQKRFRIGYALPSRNALKEHLAGAGIPQEQMVEAGLLISGDDIPVSFDRFRDRIIFPITDNRGRVIAFGGRALSPDAQAKYLNSPETPLFHKSHVLYNGQPARAASRKDGHVVAVEGYVDAIACVSAGFEATVAPLGTALTEDQLRMLWQMADEPVLCFDGDDAGLKAAFRAIDLALPHLGPGKSLRFALLPEGQDPDDFLRKSGAAAFRAVLDGAKPLVEMLWIRETQGGDISTPERQAGLEARLYKTISVIANADVLRRYRAHIRLRLVQLFNPYGKQAKGGIDATQLEMRSTRGSIERLILGFCVEFPFLLADFVEEVCAIEYSSDVYNEFKQALHLLFIDFPDLDVAAIYDRLSPRFFFVLESIHGSEKVSRATAPDGRLIRQFVRRRGSRLYLMFPALRYGPPEGLVRLTMDFLLHKLDLLGWETADPARLAETADDSESYERKVEAAVQQLNERRRRVAILEVELEEEYQILKSGSVKAA